MRDFFQGIFLQKDAQICTIFETTFFPCCPSASGARAACTKCTKRGRFSAQARRGSKRAQRGSGRGAYPSSFRFQHDQRRRSGIRYNAPVWPSRLDRKCRCCCSKRTPLSTAARHTAKRGTSSLRGRRREGSVQTNGEVKVSDISNIHQKLSIRACRTTSTACNLTACRRCCVRSIATRSLQSGNYEFGSRCRGV